MPLNKETPHTHTYIYIYIYMFVCAYVDLPPLSGSILMPTCIYIYQKFFKYTVGVIEETLK